MAVPTTASQAGLFFADQQSPDGHAYNTATVLTLRGAVPKARLVEACRHLTRAIPALRLRLAFDEWTGELVQSFSADEPEVEWHDEPDADEGRVTALIDHGTARPFDPDEGALIRFVVVRTAADRLSLAMVTHHLTIDGPCHARLGHALGRSVGGRLGGQSPDQYLDLAGRVRAAEERAQRQDSDYWQRRIPPGTRLNPWLVPNPAPAGPVSGCVLSPLGGRVLDRLAVVAGTANVTVFHLLAAAIHRALPMAGPSLTALSVATSLRPPDGSSDHVFGYFINQVPLTVRSNGGSVVDIAVRESSAWREDLRRRNFPFIHQANRIARGDAVRLDSVMTSYRKTPRILTWDSDGIHYNVDLYPRFLVAKTDLCIRLYHHDGWLEIETQWGRRIPAGLGERFNNDLLGILQDM